jgi:hypothetical protein
MAALTGCSEYEFHEAVTDPEPGLTSTTYTWTTSTTTVPDECPEGSPPAFSAVIDENCFNEPETGTFDPVVEWYKPTWSGDGGNHQVMSSPIVASVNDDNGDGVIDKYDMPDIILVTYAESGYNSNGVLRAVSGDSGAEIWSTAGAGLQGTGGVAAGDIDGDGLVEFISLTMTNAVAFENDGTIKWTSPSLSGSIYGTSDVCSITDLEGDGAVEIICGNAILSASGTLLGKGSYGRAGVSSNVGTTGFAADIDGDGIREVISGNAVYAPDGSTIWYNGQTDGYPAVADFNGDGFAEIVVSNAGTVRMQTHTGAVSWQISIPGGTGGGYGGPPTIADFDGDGVPEIGVASGSRYSVIEGDGTILWQATTDDSSSGNTGSAVFDFEGDGIAEVVYADQSRLWVFNGVDGSVKLSSTEHSNGTWMEYPVIADVDNDGNAEIVVPNTSYGSSDSGIRVFGDLNNSWMAGRPIWNQHAYSIDNINDDGTIPAMVTTNWPDHNNFRSGDMTAAVGSNAPDLALADGGNCQIECDLGKVVFWVHVGNEGLAPVDLAATLIATINDGAAVLYDIIKVPPTQNSGEFGEAIRIEIDAAALQTATSVTFSVASDLPECNDDNNSVTVEGPFCL